MIMGLSKKIINAVYQDAMGVVMMVAAGLLVRGVILTLTLRDRKKQKIGTRPNN